MPLIKSASKKALQENIKTEMEAHPSKGKRPQDLAIAFSVQRQAKKKKKMAEGGAILKELTDDEMHLQSSAAPASPKEHPSKKYDEMDQKQSSGDPDMSKEHSNGRKPYAKGGMATPEDSGVEKMERDDETRLQSSAAPSSPKDQPKHGYDEEHQHQTSGDPDETHPHTGETEMDMLRRHADELAHFAHGGMTHEMGETFENENEPFDLGDRDESYHSIADAIMAERRKQQSGEDDEFAKYAEGGQVDIKDNTKERPFTYAMRDHDVESDGDYSDDYGSDHRSSNEIGDDGLEHDKHDHIEEMRRRYKKRMD